MSDIKVSIVIACYNEDHYIAQCLDSMIAQTLQEIEIIVVDDGSTDNSLSVIKQYAVKDQRIIVLQQQHKGAAQARNLGICYAHGKYISFFDADDFVAPDCYQIMYDNAERNGSDVSVVGSQSMDNETGDTQKLEYTLKKEYLPSVNPFSSEDIPAYIFLVFNGWAWDKLFLLSFIQREKIQFQDLRSTNDMLFVDKALLYANSICVQDTILITHRINKNNSTSSTRDLSWDCFYKALLALKNVLDERKCTDEIYLSYAMWAAEFIHWQLSTYHGSAFIKAYNLLHEGGLDKLDFLRVPKEHFDRAHKEWYEYCAYIHKYDIGHYLDELWRRTADQNRSLDNLSRENRSLIEQIDNANKKIDSLNSTLKETSIKSENIQNLNDQLQTENKELIKIFNALSEHIYDMKHSLHWKIGDAVLFIPSMIYQKIKRK